MCKKHPKVGEPAVRASKEKAEGHDSCATNTLWYFSPDRPSEWAWVVLASSASWDTPDKALQPLGEGHRDSQARNEMIVSRNVSGDNPQAPLVATNPAQAVTPSPHRILQQLWCWCPFIPSQNSWESFKVASTP